MSAMPRFAFLCACVLGAVLIVGQQPQPPAQGTSPTSKVTQPANKGAQSDGEKKFKTNCGRCHHPPEQLSPHIAGSVLRHMRVRAMLSEEDAREILEYLAP